MSSIPGISASNLELLEAAGWMDPKQLAKADPKLVWAELEKANGILSLTDHAPKLKTVETWVATAREVHNLVPAGYSGLDEIDAEIEDTAEAVEDESGVDEIEELVSEQVPEMDEASAESSLVNFEAEPEVSEMLDRAPLAIPLPNRQLAESGIGPSEIPAAPVLNRAEGDLDVRVTAGLPKSPNGGQVRTVDKTPNGGQARAVDKPSNGSQVKSIDTAPPSGAVRMGEYSEGGRRGIDVTRVRSISEVQEGGEVKIARVKPAKEDERLTLLRTTRPETNRGKDPSSRWYIRGVLHDRPFKVWFGSGILLLTYLVVPLAILAATLLIISDLAPDLLPWVSEWFLVFPLLLPILGLLYFTVSCGVKCRVCGQKVLVPRHCRKNKKAHHIAGLGYIVPLAMHVMIFRWFNCTFCGTSVRIKE